MRNYLKKYHLGLIPMECYLFITVSTFIYKSVTVFVYFHSSVSHKEQPYDFKEGDWMADNFFSGGTMPSHDLLLYFQKDLHIINHWKVSGKHYERTSNDWLANMDKKEHQQEINKIFERVYGKENITKWIGKWRLFFLACAELFGYNNGDEWLISLFLFQKKQ
jgi:cyclopropane fatty-acyl-phospholipid synthase-like methyltransferase